MNCRNPECPCQLLTGRCSHQFTVYLPENLFWYLYHHKRPVAQYVRRLILDDLHANSLKHLHEWQQEQAAAARAELEQAQHLRRQRKLTNRSRADRPRVSNKRKNRNA